MSDPFALDDDLPAPPPPRPGGGVAPLAVPPGWLDGLNPEQRQAVEATDGPVLVLSGAGTGKTRVLITRLAYILATGRARPFQVLAVTFTNKAAKEMRERVAAMVGPMATQLWLGTFHSLGVRMLRSHAELVGLGSDFTILDTDDQVRLLKQIMEVEGVDTKKWAPNVVMGAIQRWKDRGLTPDAVGGEADQDFVGGRAVALYTLYQERLRVVNAADFGDLLLHCLTIFKAHPDILAEYQDKFRYILVDEYQDTNVSQYLWLRLLAQRHKNVCCVGDDDQAIYSWRGAEVGNILRFDRDFPGATVVRLERNYRSTARILAAASGLIAHNQGRLGKTLRPGDGAAPDGDKLVVQGTWDGEDEARWVVDEIEAQHRQGCALGQMAILVRAGFQTREFEERLITTGTPYRVIGGPRFYERQEIRDAMAYLRVVVQPSDGLAFERIVNVPKRGLGDATVQQLHLVSRGQGVALLAAARQLVDTDELKPKPRTTLAALIANFDRWRGLLSGLPHAELAATVLDESGYTAMWKADKSPDAPGRVENLTELVAAIQNYDSLPVFLEHVALVMENDGKAEGDRVNIMTLHAAKGLEFDHVFLPGWEEEVFPHQRALGETGQKGLEEERRLAYVGVTRARRRVFVSYAANRRIYNQWRSNLPSRFIAELPPEHVEQTARAGLYGQTAEPNAGWHDALPRGSAGLGPSHAFLAVSRGGGFVVGDRVFHQKFGYGVVRGIDDNKLDIAFDKAGDKKVIDTFVEKA